MCSERAVGTFMPGVIRRISPDKENRSHYTWATRLFADLRYDRGVVDFFNLPPARFSPLRDDIWHKFGTSISVLLTSASASPPYGTKKDRGYPSHPRQVITYPVSTDNTRNLSSEYPTVLSQLVLAYAVSLQS